MFKSFSQKCLLPFGQYMMRNCIDYFHLAIVKYFILPWFAELYWRLFLFHILQELNSNDTTNQVPLNSTRTFSTTRFELPFISPNTRLQIGCWWRSAASKFLNPLSNSGVVVILLQFMLAFWSFAAAFSNYRPVVDSSTFLLLWTRAPSFFCGLEHLPTSVDSSKFHLLRVQATSSFCDLEQLPPSVVSSNFLLLWFRSTSCAKS